MDKPIKKVFFTMGNRDVSRAVQETLFKAGIGWAGEEFIVRHEEAEVLFIDSNIITYGGKEYADRMLAGKGYQEITFRELCELAVSDKLKELGDYLATKLTQKASELGLELSEMDFCYLWQKKIKPNLDL